MVLGPQGPGRVGRRRFFIQRVARQAARFLCLSTCSTHYRYGAVVRATREANGQIALADPSRLASQPELAEALGVIHMLAEEIGPRRPCSDAEKDAANRARRLAARSGRGCARSRSSAATRPSPRRTPRCSRPRSPGDCCSAPAAAGPGAPVTCSPFRALVTAALEADLRCTPLSDRLARRPSVNVLGHVPSAGPTRRRVCLCGHLDTTRSGLMFHPRVARTSPPCFRSRRSRRWRLRPGRCCGGFRGGRAIRGAGLAGIAFALAMLLERELRGEDVPGASDNASGTAVALQLAAECAAAPLAHTEVDVLITGCEESGLLGAQAYARRHTLRAAETTFLNFDTVGGDVPLTYILREGTGAITRPAPRPGWSRMLEEIAERRPELGLEPAADHARPAHRRDPDAGARLGRGHAPRAGGDDPQLPLAHGYVREHRAARPCSAPSKPAASCCARWTPRSSADRRASSRPGV